MLALHNIFREMDSISPLIANDLLDYEAFKHAKRMARLCWLSDYKLKDSIDKLVDFKEIVWSLSLGSNAEIAIRKLVNESDTRHRLLGNYKEFGVGSYKGKNNYRYWCMLYGNLK
jgi:uncharacterized protein YkwD